MQIKIFGITYAEHKTEYIDYHNRSPLKPWQFENEPMRIICDTMIDDLQPNDLLGIFSHAFRSKTGLSKMNVIRFLTESKLGDVYNFCRGHGKHIHFMDWSDQGHPGIKDFIIRCCNHVGMVYTNDPKHIVYANQFVATKHVYVSYMNEVIKPCLELLEGAMWEEVNRDPSYSRAKPGIKYTYIPFILERMMCQFIHNRNLICRDYFKR
jgi:hypothetical protein